MSTSMSNTMTEARRKYVKHIRQDGVAIYHCGDEVALALLDRSPEEATILADKCLGMAAGYYAARYAHLNPGQIRINSGNRIRDAIKGAEKAGNDTVLVSIRNMLKGL